VVAIGLHEEVFAGDFVARVLPVGVGEWGGFGDEVVADGALIGTGGADEDELAGAIAEEADVALDLVGCESNPVDYCVPVLIGEGGGDGRFIGDIGGDGADAGGNVGGTLAAG
jgi:hypothetical protein